MQSESPAIDLTFTVLTARVEPSAAVPTLTFRLRIVEKSGAAIHAILLRCQLQILARQRRHSPVEQERLADVFGEPSRWKDTLRPLLWTSIAVIVPGYVGSVEVDMPVTCTYDFEVTAAKYLAALEGGELPLQFLFTGSAFVKSASSFYVTQIPWDKECPYPLPVRVWRDLMDHYFADCTWIRLHRESLDLLQRYKSAHSLLSWDETIRQLVAPPSTAAQRGNG